MFARIKAAIANPKQVRNSLVLRAGRLTGTRNYRKFIVLGRSRTGSNLLISLLNSQQSIIARGEIFACLKGKSHDEILSSVFCRYPQSIKAVGFKIFYYHPQDDETGEIWQRLKSIENLAVVHIKRRNILRSLVSRKIAGKIDIWSKGDNQPLIPLDQRRVSFTAEELLDVFRRTENWHKQFDDLFADNNLIHIYYEDLVDTPEKKLREVCKILGVEGSAFTTKMQRQNPESLSSLILNYSEMKDCFAGTEWSNFFED